MKYNNYSDDFSVNSKKSGNGSRTSRQKKLGNNKKNSGAKLPYNSKHVRKYNAMLEKKNKEIAKKN